LCTSQPTLAVGVAIYQANKEERPLRLELQVQGLLILPAIR
jgi:hypothetical protein